MLSEIIGYVVTSIIFALLINTNVMVSAFSETDVIQKDEYMKSLGWSMLISFSLIGLLFIIQL